MTQPRHTPAEAVQYWYDAATERREERDRLRAVVARIAQMADYWEQHLPEVIRTPAVVSALRAAMEPAEQSPADRAAVPVCDLPHETITEEDACDRRLPTDRPFRDEPTEVLQTALDLVSRHAQQAARFRPAEPGDALPAVADLFQTELQHREGQTPTDLAAVRAETLREAADHYARQGKVVVSAPQVAAELRRLAGEQPAQDEAVRCTCADAGGCFAPAGHYADCPLAATPTT